MSESRYIGPAHFCDGLNPPAANPFAASRDEGFTTTSSSSSSSYWTNQSNSDDDSDDDNNDDNRDVTVADLDNIIRENKLAISIIPKRLKKHPGYKIGKVEGCPHLFYQEKSIPFSYIREYPNSKEIKEFLDHINEVGSPFAPVDDSNDEVVPVTMTSTTTSGFSLPFVRSDTPEASVPVAQPTGFRLPARSDTPEASVPVAQPTAPVASIPPFPPVVMTASHPMIMRREPAEIAASFINSLRCVDVIRKGNTEKLFEIWKSEYGEDYKQILFAPASLSYNDYIRRYRGKVFELEGPEALVFCTLLASDFQRCVRLVDPDNEEYMIWVEGNRFTRAKIPSNVGFGMTNGFVIECQGQKCCYGMYVPANASWPSPFLRITEEMAFPTLITTVATPTSPLITNTTLSGGTESIDRFVNSILDGTYYISVPCLGFGKYIYTEGVSIYASYVRFCTMYRYEPVPLESFIMRSGGRKFLGSSPGFSRLFIEAKMGKFRRNLRTLSQHYFKFNVDTFIGLNFVYYHPDTGAESFYRGLDLQVNSAPGKPLHDTLKMHMNVLDHILTESYNRTGKFDEGNNAIIAMIVNNKTPVPTQ